MKKITLGAGLDAAKIAYLTPGFTGAELANLCNEAALAATRRKGDAVTLDDFTVAIERIVAGLEKKNRVLSVKEREFVSTPRDGPRAGGDGSPRIRQSGPCTRFRSSHAVWQRSGTRSSARPRNAI